MAPVALLSAPCAPVVRRAAAAPRRAARPAAARRAPRTRAAADGSVEIVRDDEPGRLVASSPVTEGLAISGAVMALNGGLSSFSVREDVNVTRSDENGKTTVTIKVGSRTWGGQQASVASGYLLPTVGPVPDGEEARRKQAELEAQLRKAQEDAEEAARRAKALQAQAQSAGGFGTRVPLSADALAKLAAEGGLAWSKDAEGDPTFSYYNIYRNGEPAEAVNSAADAAFAALAVWLSEQQAIVEKQFLMERDRLRRIFEAEKEAALAALRAELEAEFEAKLAEELSKQRYELEVEKQTALEKLRAEAAAATAAALAKLEEKLKAEAEAAQAALRSMYESQIQGLKDQLAALAEKHARDLETAKAIALSEKKAALAAQKKEYLSKYELIRGQLESALQLNIDGALVRIDEICKELKDFHDMASKQEII